MSIEVTEGKRRDDYLFWLAEAKQRGYKAGWAAVKYKEEYGQWPKREWQPEEVRAAAMAASGTRQPEARKCPACGHVEGTPVKKTTPSQDDFPF